MLYQQNKNETTSEMLRDNLLTPEDMLSEVFLSNDPLGQSLTKPIPIEKWYSVPGDAAIVGNCMSLDLESLKNQGFEINDNFTMAIIFETHLVNVEKIDYSIQVITL